MKNMKKQDKVLIFESDIALAKQIQDMLAEQFPQVFLPSSGDEAIKLLTEQTIQLVFLGDPSEGGSCFDLLKDFVKASPITYTILTSDKSEKETHDKAEGFGILGHIPKVFSPNKIQTLIDRYKQINQVLYMTESVV